MNVKKEFGNQLNLVLEKYNFKRKTEHWYYYKNNYILKINLQKSRYGELFYINIDLYFNDFKNLFPNKNPGIMGRIDNFIKDNLIEKEFNFEGLNQEEITRKISNICLQIDIHYGGFTKVK